MQETLERVLPVDIDGHMETAFINYAMSVIQDRALPDVRDGLKPVHRRILYAMKEMGLTPEKTTQKSAGVVGEVLKNYHPHGDSSVYDAAVRMAQPWSLGHPLISGQGNFGSRDGDGAAAYRYTEMKLAKISTHFFDGIDKNTVDFRPNFDGRIQEPTILPAAFPNILVNGTEGIAVGMATSIPPHNLREVANAVFAYLDNRDITARDISAIMKGPDFPTGGIVHDLDGYQSALDTGRGAMKLRATWHEETGKRHTLLVIDSIPYQSNKATIVSRIADLVNDKKVEEVTDLRDESDAKIRIVVELKKGASAELLFNQIISMGTGLEVSIGYNSMLLDGPEPRQMGVIEIISKWVAFRTNVIRKAAEYDLIEARHRLHILEGFMKAINVMDKVISTIRGSADGPTAKISLMDLLAVDEIQAQAILDMRLQKLTGLELTGIQNEHTKITANVADLEDFVASIARQEAVLRDDLAKIAQSFGHDRLTTVEHSLSRLSREDLVEREDVVVIITEKGYVKRIPTSAMDRQNRGTRGRSWMTTGDDDQIRSIQSGSTHDYLLAITHEGQVHAQKVYQIPEGAPGTKGRHVRNVIEGIAPDARIESMITVPDFSDDLFLVTITTDGSIKRTMLSEYAGATMKNGLIALRLEPGAELVAVDVCREDDEVVVVSSGGKAIRFIINATELRPMGRKAIGNRAIRMRDDERVVGMIVIPSGTVSNADKARYLFCIGQRGAGKRTILSEFPTHHRGRGGVTSFVVSPKTGPLVKALGVQENQDLVLISQKAITNRFSVESVRSMGRAASGVKLMNLDEGDIVVEASAVIPEPQETEEPAQ